MLLAGRYALLQPPLGVGSFGSVYEAEDRKLPRRVAVKLLHPKHAANPKVHARFSRELEAACRVAHENVIQVIDVGEDLEHGLFYVMELVPGTPLTERLNGVPMSWPETRTIANQIAAALSAIHAAGIVHRDLKPDNIMLVPRSGQRDLVKLLDFGIAWIEQVDDDRSVDLTGTEMVVGTPPYMSPEQTYMRSDRDRLGLVVDGRADLYSMGVILYELAAGHRPFSGDHIELVLAHRQTAPVPLERVGGVEAPSQFGELVGRLLAKRPDDRPASAAEVRAELTAMERLQAAPTRRAESVSEARRDGEALTRVVQSTSMGTVAAAIEDELELSRTGRPRLGWGLLAAAVVVAAIALALTWDRGGTAPMLDGQAEPVATGAEPGASPVAADGAGGAAVVEADAVQAADAAPGAAAGAGADVTAGAEVAAGDAEAGETQPVVEVAPAPPAATEATLMIVSEPAGAEVTIDGNREGITPLNVEVDATSKRTVTVRMALDGYYRKRVPVTLEPSLAGKAVMIKEALKKRRKPPVSRKEPARPAPAKDPFEDL